MIQLVGNFWLALLLAPLGVGLLGILIELGGIRPLYKAGHDYQLLLTFGLSLIVTEGIIIVWSPVGMSQLPPPLLRGGVDLASPATPKYRLFVMVAATLLVLTAWLFLEKTHYGAIMRAGIEDKEMVSLLGIDIHRLFTAAFALGCVPGRDRRGAHRADPRPQPLDGRGHARHRLRRGRAGRAREPAGLHRGGAARRRGPEPGGGSYWPEASVAVIFAVMAAVLLVRPQGLFGIR